MKITSRYQQAVLQIIRIPTSISILYTALESCSTITTTHLAQPPSNDLPTAPSVRLRRSRQILWQILNPARRAVARRARRINRHKAAVRHTPAHIEHILYLIQGTTGAGQNRRGAELGLEGRGDGGGGVGCGLAGEDAGGGEPLYER